MKSKILIGIFLIFAVFIFGCGSPDINEDILDFSEWNTHEDVEKGFKISYPEDWEMREEGPMAVFGTEGFGLIKGEGGGVAASFIENSDNTEKIAEDMISMYSSELWQKNIPNLEVLNHGEIRLGGNVGYYIKMRSGDEENYRYETKSFFSKDGVYYQVIYVAYGDEAYNEYLDIANTMRASFELI